MELSITHFLLRLVEMSNSFIWPIDNRILSGATTPGQSKLVSNGNEGVIRIPQSSNITGASPSDCLMSNQGHSWGGECYPQERCSRCLLQQQLTCPLRDISPKENVIAHTTTMSMSTTLLASNECPGYDTKQPDSEVPVMLELWLMRSTPSLPLLPCPLWLGVVAPDKALSMG